MSMWKVYRNCHKLLYLDLHSPISILSTPLPSPILIIKQNLETLPIFFSVLKFPLPPFGGMTYITKKLRLYYNKLT